MKNFILVVLAALSLGGCLSYQARVLQDMTPEQIDAIARLRAASGSDFYICLSGSNGPPPGGGAIIIAYPKEAPKPSLLFTSGCQIAPSLPFVIEPAQMRLVPR